VSILLSCWAAVYKSRFYLAGVLITYKWFGLYGEADNAGSGKKMKDFFWDAAGEK
jgi:hypothetical protein